MSSRKPQIVYANVMADSEFLSNYLFIQGNEGLMVSKSIVLGAPIVVWVFGFLTYGFSF